MSGPVELRGPSHSSNDGEPSNTSVQISNLENIHVAANIFDMILSPIQTYSDFLNLKCCKVHVTTLIAILGIIPALVAACVDLKTSVHTECLILDIIVILLSIFVAFCGVKLLVELREGNCTGLRRVFAQVTSEEPITNAKIRKFIVYMRRFGSVTNIQYAMFLDNVAMFLICFRNPIKSSNFVADNKNTISDDYRIQARFLSQAISDDGSMVNPPIGIGNGFINIDSLCLGMDDQFAIASEEKARQLAAEYDRYANFRCFSMDVNLVMNVGIILVSFLGLLTAYLNAEKIATSSLVFFVGGAVSSGLGVSIGIIKQILIIFRKKTLIPERLLLLTNRSVSKKEARTQIGFRGFYFMELLNTTDMHSLYLITCPNTEFMYNLFESIPGHSTIASPLRCYILKEPKV